MSVRPAESTGAPIAPPNQSAPPRSAQAVRNPTEGTGTRVIERPAQGVNRPVPDHEMARYSSR